MSDFTDLLASRLVQGDISVGTQYRLADAHKAAIAQAVEEERARGEKLKIELERLIKVHLMDCEEDCVAIEVARKGIKEWKADNEA